MLQIALQPYADPVFNLLETLSLSSSLFIAVMSTMLLQYHVSDPAFAAMEAPAMTPTQWVVTAALVLANASTVLCMTLVWVFLQLHRAKASMSRFSIGKARPAPIAAVMYANQNNNNRFHAANGKRGAKLLASRAPKAIPGSDDKIDPPSEIVPDPTTKATDVESLLRADRGSSFIGPIESHHSTESHQQVPPAANQHILSRRALLNEELAEDDRRHYSINPLVAPALDDSKLLGSAAPQVLRSPDLMAYQSLQRASTSAAIQQRAKSQSRRFTATPVFKPVNG
jgi:hypothetical protein